MTPLTSFYDHVLPHAPGCDAPLALIAIRESLREFHRLTKIQRFDFTGAGIAVIEAGPAAFQDVTVPGLPAATILHELELAWWNTDDKNPLGLVGPQTDMFYGADSSIATSGIPLYASIADQNVIRLFPAPIANGVLRGRAVLIPGPTAATCLPRVFDQHYEIVARGALANLMLSPRKPWTNFDLGTVLRSEFVGACSALSIMLGQGMTYAPMRTRSVDRIEE